MHIELLVEDSSGHRLLDILLPQILGLQGQTHTWRVTSYKGMGRIPKNLNARADPSKRILLDRLRQVLPGLGKTPGMDAVVIVIDADKRDCKIYLDELKTLAETCNPRPTTMFRLAIEEIEAWYLGDVAALMGAYPRAKRSILQLYAQDSACDTWELLADAVHPGGSTALKKAGWPLPGQIKHEWAAKIGPLMVLDKNASPSFRKFRDGLRRLIG